MTDTLIKEIKRSRPMNAPELLPCPFCGGKPYLMDMMVGCSYVVCTDCRMQSDDGTQERVRAAWNRRSTAFRAAQENAKC